MPYKTSKGIALYTKETCNSDPSRFGVTVYRCTGLDDDSLVAFSRQLGELERVYQYAGQEVRNPEIYKPGNTDEQGNIIKKGSRYEV